MAPDDGSRDDNITAEQEAQSIRQTVEQFAQGIRSLDAELISSVFHPRSNSFTVTTRGICVEPAEAWPSLIEQAKSDPAHLFREQFSIRILTTDIVGTAAMAKVEWLFESAKIVDFYNLLKTEGKWLIVGQVYHTYM